MGATASSAPALAFVALLASTASMATDTLNLSYIASIMEGPAAATCIATVNSVGNLGGLIGPFMIGVLKRSDDDHFTGALALSIIAAVSAAVALSFPDPRQQALRLAKRKRSSTGLSESASLELEWGMSLNDEEHLLHDRLRVQD